jgi:ParB-like chromosome segregation protein Spo0J
MKQLSQTLETVAVEEISPHPDNPRRGDLDKIGESIDHHGWFGAVLAQRSTGYILAGNHRYQAAVARGARELPVLWVDVDDDQARRILLADNTTSDAAGYADDALARLLAELSQTAGALAGTGFEDADLDRLIGNIVQAEPTPAPDQSGEIDDCFDLIVTCSSESDQLALLDRLVAEGYPCRPLIS